MENGFNVKKQGILARLAQHPAGAFLGGAVAAVVCGIMGAFNGEIVAAVMAGLGAIVGAPLGAMLASSGARSA